MSFEVGVSISLSGSHSSPTKRELLDLLDLGELLVDLVDTFLHLGPQGRIGGQIGQRCVLPTVRSCPDRRRLRIEHQDRRAELAVVTDRRCLADQRDGLQRGLEVCRADVLATRRDDQLLLAIDDAQVTVVVELADVAREQPAIDERRARLFGLLEVSLEHVATTAEHFVVVAEHHVATRYGLADVAEVGWPAGSTSSGRSTRSFRRSR